MRAYTRYIADHVVRNAALGRQLARLAEQAGFRVRKVILTYLATQSFFASATPYIAAVTAR
jgi:hypothetical protein